MKRSAINDLLVACTFFAGLLAPAMALVSGQRARAFEERPLAPPPRSAIGDLFDPGLYAGWTNYLVDRNPLREISVIAYSRLARMVTGDAATGQIVAGEDGFLFLRETISAPCLERLLVERQVDQLAMFFKALDAAGKPYVFAIAPDKAAVYSDKLSPASSRLARCAVANRAIYRETLAAADIEFVDLWALMEQLRIDGQEQAYSPEDTHWTEYGAAAFVSAVAEKLTPQLIHDGPMLAGDSERKPDLGRMAGLYFSRRFPEVKLKRDGVQNRDSVTIEHDAPGRPYVHNVSTSTAAPLSRRRLLVIHDSFMYVAWDQLAQFYADAFYLHWDSATPERLAALIAEADMVLVESVERETDERLALHFADSMLTDAVANGLGAKDRSAAPEWPRQPENNALGD